MNRYKNLRKYQSPASDVAKTLEAVSALFTHDLAFSELHAQAERLAADGVLSKTTSKRALKVTQYSMPEKGYGGPVLEMYEYSNGTCAGYCLTRYDRDGRPARYSGWDTDGQMLLDIDYIYGPDGSLQDRRVRRFGQDNAIMQPLEEAVDNR